MRAMLGCDMIWIELIWYMYMIWYTVYIYIYAVHIYIYIVDLVLRVRRQVPVIICVNGRLTIYTTKCTRANQFVCWSLVPWIYVKTYNNVHTLNCEDFCVGYMSTYVGFISVGLLRMSLLFVFIGNWCFNIQHSQMFAACVAIYVGFIRCFPGFF